MEQIQNHPIQDIWRVKYGLLVVVRKYKNVDSWLNVSSKQVKVVRGCKNLRELKEDYVDRYSSKVYPKGTLLMGTTPVEAITNVADFYFEVKASGGTIEGSLREVQEALNDVDSILNKYRIKDELE
jgi:hypothetical protein